MSPWAWLGILATASIIFSLGYIIGTLMARFDSPWEERDL